MEIISKRQAIYTESLPPVIRDKETPKGPVIPEGFELVSAYSLYDYNKTTTIPSKHEVIVYFETPIENGTVFTAPLNFVYTTDGESNKADVTVMNVTQFNLSSSWGINWSYNSVMMPFNCISGIKFAGSDESNITSLRVDANSAVRTLKPYVIVKIYAK